MQSRDIRQGFISYFEKQKHRQVPSSRLIPEGDPTLLFTNAGMNQFKNVFTGLEQRDYTRAVTAQKCVRAGGKHNDLENVGQTARHHTFFEMMGNFSFGDYFKKDAIHFAWELVTKDFGIDKDRLYVTVFTDDDEAADIWHKQEGVSKDRIYRFGEKDNFWRMGEAGPCGPCSEIFYDLGPSVPGDPKANVMGGEGDRFMEFWNLVFMQYEEDGKGGRVNLPRPSVDTGGGLERMATILQGKISNYDTDVFQDLIQVAARLSGHEYGLAAKSGGEKLDVALRVLADHARATSFLIADGVLPSNEGRGYVLRRIMRRAIRFGHQLTEEQSLLSPVVSQVITKMSEFYGELNQQRTLIERTVHDEEKRFLTTLDQGTHLLSQELEKLKSGGTLSGDAVFRLYDTFGFPVDLTRLMAEEKGFHVDELGFEKNLEQAKVKARASWKGKALGSDAAFMVTFSQKVIKELGGETEFNGYETSQDTNVKLIALSDGQKEVDVLKAEETGLLVTNKTCFYAEGGGQVGDKGVIRGPGGEAEVLDTVKQNGVFMHHVRLTDGVLKRGDLLQLVVNTFDRRSTANNHSATHLMHAALKKVLGSHVQQAGSLVDPDRLRFDFTHNSPLTLKETEDVEALVNAEIAKGIQVSTEVMAQKAAIERGALALFGEKYGDEVRVIQMGEFSMELCGGTHVSNTSQIRFFKIVSESGVSSGVRRVEAITGERAAQYLDRLATETLKARASTGLNVSWQKYLEAETPDLSSWITQSQEQVKALQREIQQLKGSGVDLEALVKSSEAFQTGGQQAQFVFAALPVDDRKVLSDLSDRLQDRLKTAVIVILGQGESSHPLIVSVSKSLAGQLNAGKILGAVATTLGGKGGGRPDFAQGAVPSRTELDKARQTALSLVSQ